MNRPNFPSPQLRQLAIAFCLTFTLVGAGCAQNPPAAGRTTAAPAVPSPTQAAEASSAGPLRPSLGAPLQAWIEYALAHSPSVQIAYRQWRRQLHNARQVPYLPDPRFSYSYMIDEVETRVGPQNHRFSVSQTFPWLAKLKWKTRAAQAAARVAEAQLNAAVNGLIYDLQQVYYELYYNQHAVEATEENVRLLQRLEQVARTRLEAGGSLASVSNAQLELERLQNDLQTLRARQAPLQARLNALLHPSGATPLPSPEQFTVRTNFPPLDPLPPDRSSSPALQQAQAQQTQAEADLEAARREPWPNITLGVDYVETGEARMPGVMDSGKDPVMAMISITIPTWWGKYRAVKQAAEENLKAVQAEAEATVSKLSVDLELARFDTENAARSIRLYQQSLEPLARQSLLITEQSYKAGRANFNDLIDAQQLLLQVQLSYHRSVADWHIAQARIQQLLGTSSAAAPFNQTQTQFSPKVAHE